MFATTLKDLRNLRKITQKDLAREFNLTQQAIGKWEKGVSMPDYETLGKIADYFEVSVDYLIGHEKKPATSSDEPSEKDILYRAFCAADQGVQQSVLKLLDLPSAPFAQKLA